VTLKESGIEQVGPDSFKFIKLLGGGSFGKVFHVKHKQTEFEYAMKIMEKSKVAKGSLLRYAVTERNVLSYIRHPYIVSLHYAFQTKQHLVLVLQYCPGGDLQKRISEERRIDEPRVRLWSAEVLTGLAHLHDRDIVYRDMKPENVVLDREGHCLLTDFGLSKEGVTALTQSFCGSLAFLAPEVLANRGHGHTVDIYGLGVLIFALLTGRPPFYDSSRERLINNIQGAALVIPPYVSNSAGDIIRGCMQREPRNRMGAAKTRDIQKHPFLAGLDFDALLRREIPVPDSARPTLLTTPNNAADAPVPSPFGPRVEAHRRGGFCRAWWRNCIGLETRALESPTNGNTRDIPAWEFTAFQSSYGKSLLQPRVSATR
jgi:serine/threonine protein kinase